MPELVDDIEQLAARGVLVRAAGPVATREDTPRPGGLLSMQLGTTAESVLGHDPSRTRALIKASGGQVVVANSRQECGAGTGYILDPGERLEIRHRGQVFARALSITSPGTRNPSPSTLQTITGAAPAAGSQWSLVVPTGESWEIVSARAQLVTSATVAARQTSLAIDNPSGTTVYRFTSTPSQAASQTWAYTWSTAGIDTANRSGEVASAIPPQLIVGAGYTIRPTFNSGFQADDQWGIPTALVYRYADTFTTISVLNEGYE